MASSSLTSSSRTESGAPRKQQLLARLSSNSLQSNKDSFKSSNGLNRRRKQTIRKISRVKQQVMTEKYVKSMNENAHSDSKRKSESVKLLKFLWKDVKSRETENLNMTLDYDAVDLRELDPQGTLIKYATSYNYIDVVAILLRNHSPIAGSGEDGLSALHLAIKLGFIPLLAVILANSDDINVQAMYEQRTPLHVAVRVNSFEALALLLQNGADANRPDIYGSTPLHLAARLGRDNLIKEMLDNGGATIDARDNEGWTSLHNAAEAGHLATVNLLLERNAFVDVRSKYGKTPLHFASEYGRLRIVQALLNKGACPLVKDLNDKSATNYASTPGVRTLLQSAISNKDSTSSVFCAPRSNTTQMTYTVRNQSLIDLLDLDQFNDPYAHDLDMKLIGKNAKNKQHYKSMPHMLEPGAALRHASDDMRSAHESSIKSSMSFASFQTISDSEIAFTAADHGHTSSLPAALSLQPIAEEERSPRASAHFRLGADSSFSDSASERKISTSTAASDESSRLHAEFAEPILHEAEVYSSIDSSAPSTITTATTATTASSKDTSFDTASTKRADVRAATKTAAAHEQINVIKVSDSFKCKVPSRRLIATLELMHEKVDTSVDRSVDVLNDVFRDVTTLRHRQHTFDANTQENTFNDIEKNIKDVVVKLKELKIRFDKQIMDV